ncbi:unnamed protein product [Nezara viridula]|uniref:Uncharacterized protein n=1 Tax=Nezara viridula TaxID=85310 RepID=A0A9P0MEX9_NEZVI|nr:unnamed protein product [Nezara viridula]
MTQDSCSPRFLDTRKAPNRGIKDMPVSTTDENTPGHNCCGRKGVWELKGAEYCNQDTKGIIGVISGASSVRFHSPIESLFGLEITGLMVNILSGGTGSNKSSPKVSEYLTAVWRETTVSVDCIYLM